MNKFTKFLALALFFNVASQRAAEQATTTESLEEVGNRLLTKKYQNLYRTALPDIRNRIVKVKSNLRMDKKGCCRWAVETVTKPNDPNKYQVETKWECGRKRCDWTCKAGICTSTPYIRKNGQWISLLPNGEAFVGSTGCSGYGHRSDPSELEKQWTLPEDLKTEKRFVIDQSIDAARQYVLNNRLSA